MRIPSHEASRAMTPMTTTMNALRASARSTPPARSADRAGPPGRPSRSPRPSTAAVGADRRPAARGPPPRRRRRTTAPEEGQDEDEHEDHQSCSSGSSSRSRSPNSERRRWASTMRTTTPKQHVEGDAELDQERHAGRAQEGHQGDAVVDQQQPDDLEDGTAPGHQDEEAEEQVATPTGTSAPAVLPTKRATPGWRRRRGRSGRRRRRARRGR